MHCISEDAAACRAAKQCQDYCPNLKRLMRAVRKEQDLSIEQEIECPRSHDVMTLCSEFDRLGYFCEVNYVSGRDVTFRSFESLKV